MKKIILTVIAISMLLTNVAFASTKTITKSSVDPNKVVHVNSVDPNKIVLNSVDPN